MKRFLIISLVFSLIFIAAAVAQMMPQRQSFPPDTFGRELFNYRIYNFADLSDRSKSLAECYFSLVNDLLTFVKVADEDFRCKYDLEMVIYNKKHETIAYQIISDTLRVAEFLMTNDRKRTIRKTMTFSLPPGAYEYRLQILDAEGNAILQRQATMNLADFSLDNFQMSDIVFADSFDCASHFFVPNLRNSFNSEKSQLAVFFEVFPPQPSDSIDTEYTLTDGSGGRLFEQHRNLSSTDKIDFCLNLRDYIKKPGEYYFTVIGHTGKKMVKSQQKFTMLWGNLSIHQANMDIAIEQLDLIAKGNVIKELKQAKGEEQQRLYDEFWQKRDPTPGTPENELRDVFFQRIDFTNRNFSEPFTGREGWRTDRGHVFIPNGPPDDIEKQPTEMNASAAEIWYYRKLNRRYIFSDRQGNGEYRLIKTE